MTTHPQFSHSATRSRESMARHYALADALTEAHLPREADPLERADYFPLYVATFCSAVVAFLVMFS